MKLVNAITLSKPFHSSYRPDSPLDGGANRTGPVSAVLRVNLTSYDAEICYFRLQILLQVSQLLFILPQSFSKLCHGGEWASGAW